MLVKWQARLPAQILENKACAYNVKHTAGVSCRRHRGADSDFAGRQAVSDVEGQAARAVRAATSEVRRWPNPEPTLTLPYSRFRQHSPLHDLTPGPSRRRSLPQPVYDPAASSTSASDEEEAVVKRPLRPSPRASALVAPAPAAAPRARGESEVVRAIRESLARSRLSSPFR